MIFIDSCIIWYVCKALSEANWQNCENLYHPENFSFSSCASGFPWSYSNTIAFGMDLEDPASNEEINFFGRPPENPMEFDWETWKLKLIPNQRPWKKQRKGCILRTLGVGMFVWCLTPRSFRWCFCPILWDLTAEKNLRIHPFLKGQSI